MDLFSMFKGEAKPQQNQNQQQQQQNNPADFRQNGGSSIQNSDNGIQPNQQQQQQQQNPLDSFTQLWQNPSQGGQTQQAQQGQAQQGCRRELLPGGTQAGRMRSMQ